MGARLQFVLFHGVGIGHVFVERVIMVKHVCIVDVHAVIAQFHRLVRASFRKLGRKVQSFT
jgi:hypothetical protein